MREENYNVHVDRILVVDDTTANLQYLTNILTKQGYIVHPASDGELALRFVQSILPDIILLDIKMPGMDGYEVCRRLKTDERTSSIPIIFISILEDERDKVKGFQAGGVDYITKPFQPEEVLARVRIHLRLRDLNVRLEQEVRRRTEELTSANQKLKQEIIEREQAEQNIALLNFALNNVGEAAFLIDENARFHFVNAESCRILGYTRAELLDLGVPDVDPDFPLDRWLTHWNELKTQRSIIFEGRHQAKNGRIFPVEINTNYFEYCGQAYNMALVHDITERKRADEALWKSERKYRLVADNTYDWEFWTDLEGRFLYSSPSCMRVTGHTPAEFLADPTLLERITHQEDRMHHAEHQRQTRNATHPGEIEFRVILPDGTERWIGHVCQAVFDEHGVLIGRRGSNRDITERKRAEESLHRLNRELHAISNCNQVLMRTTDEQTLLAEICRIVCEDAGYRMAWVGYFENDAAKTVRPVAWAGIEDGYLDTANITWADTERGRGPAGTAIRSGKTDCAQDFTTEVRMAPWRESALQRGYRSTLAVPLKDESDKVFGVFVVYSTEPYAITPEESRLMEELAGDLAFGIGVLRGRLERQQAETALREREEKYRTLIQKLQAAVVVHGPDTGIVTCNPMAQSLLGLTEDQLLGKTSVDPEWKFIHKDGTAMPVEEYPANQVAATRLPLRNLVVGVHRPNKPQDVWVMANADPVFDHQGKIVETIVTFIDITERMHAEAEVERLKNYLANIIESMPSVLVGMDRDNIITQWNQQAEKMTGIPAPEAIGRPISQLLPDFSPLINALRSEIEQHRAASMEKLLIEKEGARRFFDFVLYPLITNGVEGAVLRIEDVTERTRIQELMIQTEKMMSLGGLAAGMAHEINNPLGIITQAAQNIERRISLELPANRQAAEALGVSLEGIKTYFEQRQIPEFVGSIRTASLRAARIVANMLQFSRRAETTMQPASLSGILDQAVELAGSDYDLKKKYDFRSIEIIRDYAPDVPLVPMVSVEMEQVMLNLLKNAAQAVDLNPSDRKPRITLRLRREARYALFEIEDNGPGMTEDIRRRVFEPFFTTKEPGLGTGLGLSVSYMIVTQNHKGLMEVESTPGRGACFRVRLPLSKEGIHEHSTNH